MAKSTQYFQNFDSTLWWFNFQRVLNFRVLKGVYPIIFSSNVFHNSQLFQKCIHNQQQLLILYTFLNQMRVVKNIRRKDDGMNSLYILSGINFNLVRFPSHLKRKFCVWPMFTHHLGMNYYVNFLGHLKVS